MAKLKYALWCIKVVEEMYGVGPARKRWLAGEKAEAVAQEMLGGAAPPRAQEVKELGWAERLREESIRKSGGLGPMDQVVDAGTTIGAVIMGFGLLGLVVGLVGFGLSTVITWITGG